MSARTVAPSWAGAQGLGRDVKSKRDRRDRARGLSIGWMPMVALAVGHWHAEAAPILPPTHQTIRQHIKVAVHAGRTIQGLGAHPNRRCFSDAARRASVSPTDLADMVCDDPADALGCQSENPDLLRRQARKISRTMQHLLQAAEIVAAAATPQGTSKHGEPQSLVGRSSVASRSLAGLPNANIASGALP